MDFYGDYHTHTKYSDAKSTIIENVQAASKRGLKEIAITDHGLGHIVMGMTPSKIIKAKKDISIAQKAYPDVNVLFGIESNIIGTDGTIDITPDQVEEFDIILCGYHRVAKAKDFSSMLALHVNGWLNAFFGLKPTKHTLAANTKAMIKTIQNNPIAVLTHINNYMLVDVGEVAKCCADYGTFMELNSKHIDIAPKDFEKMLKTEVKFIANTDSHRCVRVGNFKLVEELINDYPEAAARIVNLNAKTSPAFRKYK